MKRLIAIFLLVAVVASLARCATSMRPAPTSPPFPTTDDWATRRGSARQEDAVLSISFRAVPPSTLG